MICISQPRLRVLSNPLDCVMLGHETLDYFRFAIGPQNIDLPARTGIFPRHESWSLLGHPSNMRLWRPGSSQLSCLNLRFSNPRRDGLMRVRTIGPKHLGQRWGRIAMRLGSNKTVNDGMRQPLTPSGSTTLSVTGRYRNGAVIVPPWNRRHFGQFTKRADPFSTPV